MLYKDVEVIHYLCPQGCPVPLIRHVSVLCSLRQSPLGGFIFSNLLSELIESFPDRMIILQGINIRLQNLVVKEHSIQQGYYLFSVYPFKFIYSFKTFSWLSTIHSEVLHCVLNSLGCVPVALYLRMKIQPQTLNIKDAKSYNEKFYFSIISEHNATF